MSSEHVRTTNIVGLRIIRHICITTWIKAESLWKKFKDKSSVIFGSVVLRPQPNTVGYIVIVQSFHPNNLCVWKAWVHYQSSVLSQKITSTAPPHVCLCMCVHRRIQSDKPSLCFFSLTVPALSLSLSPRPLYLHRHFFFFDYCPSLFSFSLPLLPFPFPFLCLFLSFSDPPLSLSLTPFLWLAVSLGLCTFLAGKSEALSKHQLPRAAQRNPTWLFLHCRPPLLTPPLSSQLLHSLSHKYPCSPLTPINSPSNLLASRLGGLLPYTKIL